MFKKIALITLASFALGGCSLASLTGNQAVSDQKDSEVVATSTPTPATSQDSELSAMPSPGTGNDDQTLETDINNTVILNEDFSDLK